MQHLYKNGWTRDDLKEGETITVTGATRSWNDTAPDVKAFDYRLGGGVITNAAGQRVYTSISKDEAREEEESKSK